MGLEDEPLDVKMGFGEKNSDARESAARNHFGQADEVAKQEEWVRILTSDLNKAPRGESVGPKQPRKHKRGKK